MSKTYQTIDYKELKEIVGNLKDDEMNKLIKSKGWKKLEDNYVFVANHEENIKTKNIVEKIKFEGNCSLNWIAKLILNKKKIFFLIDVSTVMSAAIKSQVVP